MIVKASFTSFAQTFTFVSICIVIQKGMGCQETRKQITLQIQQRHNENINKIWHTYVHLVQAMSKDFIFVLTYKNI